MKKAILLFLLATISTFGWAQNSRKLIIVDKETKKAIPYATIVYLSHSGGTYSDESGICFINNVDSLLVRHVSYQELIVDFNEQSDSVFLEIKPQMLNLIEVNASRLNDKKRPRYKFSKRKKFGFNLSSLEIGKIIPLEDKPLSNVYIPFRKPDTDLKVAIKLYSVNNNNPDQLLYQEVQIIGSKSGDYISFKKDLTGFCLNTSAFVSIEMISNENTLKNVRKPMELFLTAKQDVNMTNATRNFAVTKKWANQFIQEQKPLNLIVFSE